MGESFSAIDIIKFFWRSRKLFAIVIAAGLIVGLAATGINLLTDSGSEPTSSATSSDVVSQSPFPTMTAEEYAQLTDAQKTSDLQTEIDRLQAETDGYRQSIEDNKKSVGVYETSEWVLVLPENMGESYTARMTLLSRVYSQQIAIAQNIYEAMLPNVSAESVLTGSETEQEQIIARYRKAFDNNITLTVSDSIISAKVTAPDGDTLQAYKNALLLLLQNAQAAAESAVGEHQRNLSYQIAGEGILKSANSAITNAQKKLDANVLLLNTLNTELQTVQTRIDAQAAARAAKRTPSAIVKSAITNLVLGAVGGFLIAALICYIQFIASKKLLGREQLGCEMPIVAACEDAKQLAQAAAADTMMSMDNSGEGYVCVVHDGLSEQTVAEFSENLASAAGCEIRTAADAFSNVSGVQTVKSAAVLLALLCEGETDAAFVKKAMAFSKQHPGAFIGAAVMTGGKYFKSVLRVNKK